MGKVGWWLEGSLSVGPRGCVEGEKRLQGAPLTKRWSRKEHSDSKKNNDRNDEAESNPGPRPLESPSLGCWGGLPKSKKKKKRRGRGGRHRRECTCIKKKGVQ